jgi:hypothetical protein
MEPTCLKNVEDEDPVFDGGT